MKLKFLSVLICLLSQAFTSAVAHSAEAAAVQSTSSGALTKYCQFLRSRVRLAWKIMPGFDHPVVIDFDVDADGKIRGIGAASCDKSTSEARVTAGLLVAWVKQIVAPPSGPLRMQISLCNRIEKIDICVRDVDWSAYVLKLNKSVIRAWSPAGSNSGRYAVVRITLSWDGRVERVLVSHSSGFKDFDKSVTDALNGPVIFDRFPDGGPERKDFEIYLESAHERIASTAVLHYNVFGCTLERLLNHPDRSYLSILVKCLVF
ncbi:MAG: TonB family protein [Candidatus Melainabacteria bacterium]|nr:TonB family protein [Candidatus Melainabacteria bacterium]